ncbi:hypothetical protein E2C01_037836 [Portunus trituberculatus]|uniref:Uncharacterized protein n=1 Tax=Portunus trituberculatus TaxID=210409 RepID=A0A5B7FCJ0_PORTR|nr:hypothetical protein [Portunus trituberculatus]
MATRLTGERREGKGEGGVKGGVMARWEDLVTQRSGSFLPFPPRDSSTVSGGARAGKAKLGTEIEMSSDTAIRVVWGEGRERSLSYLPLLCP